VEGLAAGDNTLADLIDATQEELKKRQGEPPERIARGIAPKKVALADVDSAP
jgi:hypothetical protein